MRPRRSSPTRSSASTAAPPAAVPADWGIYPNLFNVEDATFAFLEDVLREVMELFPGQYIHVGGDEAVKDQWQASPRVQQRMRELGIADEHALQSYFIQRIGRFLDRERPAADRLGRDPRGRPRAGCDRDVLARHRRRARGRGRRATMRCSSPWPTLYFDNRQGAGVAEPPGRGRVIALEDVYRFDPMPPALAAAQRRHMLGLQANLWTEHIRTEDRARVDDVPARGGRRRGRLVARRRGSITRISSGGSSAMRGWHEALGLGCDDARLRAPWRRRGRASRRSQELKLCSDKLVLTLEDDAPLQGERAVFLVDIMQPVLDLRGARISRGVTVDRRRVGQFPFNFQIGQDRDEIQLRPPATRGRRARGAARRLRGRA